MKITDFVSADAIVLHLAASTAEDALAELASVIARLHGLDVEQVRTSLFQREQLGSTAIGNELAVPHAKLDVARPMGALGLSEEGVEFVSPDGAPVRICVAFVSPRAGGAHLKALAAVARTLGDPGFRAKLLEAGTAADVHRLLSSVEDEVRTTRE